MKPWIQTSLHTNLISSDNIHHATQFTNQLKFYKYEYNYNYEYKYLIEFMIINRSDCLS